MPHPDYAVGPAPAFPETEPAGLDLSDRPVVAAVNLLAAALLEILRPFVWQALILLYLLAQFSPN